MIEAISAYFNSLTLPSVDKRKLNRPKQLVASPKRAVVDEVIGYLLMGYEVANEGDPDKLGQHMQSVPVPLRPVVYEGMYATLATKDMLEKNGGERVAALAMAEPTTAPQMNSGIGAALSILQIEGLPPSLTDSFFGWVTFQARGSYDGYFRWPISIAKQEVPADIPQWALQAYDEGLGAALWYIGAANPRVISSMIEKFPPKRRRHLWDGVGLVIGLWGLHDEKDMKDTLRHAGRYRADLQQGIAVGAAGCILNNMWPEHIESACNIFLHARGQEIMNLTSEALASVGEQFTQANQFVEWKRNLMRSLRDST